MKTKFLRHLLIYLVVAACFFLITPAMAEEDTGPQPLVGISVGQAKANFNNYSSSSTTSAGFLLGVDYQQFRVYADLSFYKWQGAKTRTIYANVDYQHEFTPWLTGFAGLYFGLVDLEFDDPKDYQSGPAGGAQLGVLMPLGQSSWQLEAAARFTGMSAEQDLPSQDDEPAEKAKITGQTEAQLRLVFVY